MGSVQISTYQIVNYFLSGFVVVFTCFLVYAPCCVQAAAAGSVALPCSFTDCIRSLAGSQLALGFILSFLAGIVINAFRNTAIEFLFFEKYICLRLKLKFWKFKSLAEKIGANREETEKYCKINWDFFHTASKEYLDQVESAYYVFYSGAFNISIALFASGSLLLYRWPKEFTGDKTVWIIYSAAAILFFYAIWPLRRQMIRASHNTEYKNPIVRKCVNNRIVESSGVSDKVCLEMRITLTVLLALVLTLVYLLAKI